MSEKQHTQPSDTEIIQEIRTRSVKLANCIGSHSTIIKRGPKTYKVASVLQFTNPDTGEKGHRQLTLNDYPFRVGTGIQWDKKDRLAHWRCQDDEIQQLLVFLSTYDQAEAPGTYTVIEGRPTPTLQELLKAIGTLNSPNLSGIIAALAERSVELRTLPPLGETDNRRMVASALRAAHRMTALDTLRQLIQTNAREEEFQRLLDANWWMLGGQYVEKIEKRHWTDEETLDMMLKSADGNYDIIELKRSNVPLFKEHRKKWIVSSDVNDAVNQAGHYISEIDRLRDHFVGRYKVDLYKVRAKILIGYIDDDDSNAEAQRLALRMYNSHLHGIEVIPFDGMVRICNQVIHANQEESKHAAPSPSEDADATVVPF
jgi:hypothetical protein